MYLYVMLIHEFHVLELRIETNVYDPRSFFVFVLFFVFSAN